MDRLWTLFQIRHRGSYSPAELETPNINGAKENKKGKKTWKNIFSRDRKPKDAGKLLKEEALEDKVPQKKEKKKWKNIFSRDRKPKDARKLLKEEALEGQVPKPGVLELHTDTEAGALKNISLDEPRDVSLVEPGDVSLDEPRDVSLDETRGDIEMLLPVEELEAEAEALTITCLDETRGDTEMLLPVEELEAEAEALTITCLDETRGDTEMLLPVGELEAEAEALTITCLDETRGNAEMLLPARELEAEPEALKDLIKTSLVKSEETELHGRRKKIRRGTRGRGRKINYKKKDNNGSEIINKVNAEAEAEAEAKVLTNTSLDETRDNAEMLLPARELEAEPEVLTNTSLEETKGNAEMLLLVRELEAEPEVLTNTSLEETKGNAEMLLLVRELEAEPEALKDLIKTSLVESEETELQNRGDTEADLFSKDNDGSITGEHGRRKKIRRGTRGRGRKINYKKKDNNGSEMINEVNAEAEAEAEVAAIKNVHLDEKDSSADLLNPDQPLGEERKQWMGQGDPEDGLKQKKKIRRGTRGRGRKIIYKKDASKA